MEMAIALAIGLASAVAFIFSSLLILYVAYFKLYKHRIDPNDAELAHPTAASIAAANSVVVVRRFESSEIDAMAFNFTPSTIIGEGGFSTVYLASLQQPPSLVAVKVHNSSQRLHRAFRQELDALRRVVHPHVVRLLGYCDDRDEGVLVFEFVPNGTLHDSIHASSSSSSSSSSSGSSVLPWAHRMTILFRLASALDYLHEGCELQIIHGDVKSSNVLLDHFLEPKLCDFGCARMGFSATVTRSADQMMGSLGYVDPHYLRTGLVSKKSDVYSFGVLILELVTGTEAFDSEKERMLTTVMRPVLRVVVDGEERIGTGEFVDPRLGDEYDVDEVVAMTAIAAKCVAEQPALRPSMADVVKLMSENVSVIRPKGKEDTVN